MDAETIVETNTTSIWEIAFFHAEYCKINCTRREFMFDKKRNMFASVFLLQLRKDK